jgi:hypothetical protein
MNYLKRSKENYCTNYCQDDGIVYGIFFCCRVVKGREHLHYNLVLSEEFNIVLPFLETSDLIKHRCLKKEYFVFICLISKNRILLKMICDLV